MAGAAIGMGAETAIGMGRGGSSRRHGWRNLRWRKGTTLSWKERSWVSESSVDGTMGTSKSGDVI